MEKVSILEFRRDAEAVIRKVLQGKRLILTYRGKPVMRLEPIGDGKPSADDPFYSLGQIAVSDGRSLTNEEIDQIVYET
jgi:antitoxin (DNA-binding transcriptional repressor) of toxin-antitoxin stability system